MRLTIGSAIAPHFCISPRQSFHRSPVLPVTSLTVSIEHSPTNRRKSCTWATALRVDSPTSTTRLCEWVSWPAVRIEASNCPERRRIFSGRGAVSQGIPAAPHQRCASPRKTMREVSHWVTPSALSRTEEGLAPPTTGPQRGVSPLSLQGPSRSTSRTPAAVRGVARAGVSSRLAGIASESRPAAPGASPIYAAVTRVHCTQTMNQRPSRLT